MWLGIEVVSLIWLLLLINLKFNFKWIIWLSILNQLMKSINNSIFLIWSISSKKSTQNRLCKLRHVGSISALNQYSVLLKITTLEFSKMIYIQRQQHLHFRFTLRWNIFDVHSYIHSRLQYRTEYNSQGQIHNCLKCVLS